MSSKIALFNISRAKIGEVVQDGPQITLNLDKNVPAQTSEKLSEFLKDICQAGFVKIIRPAHYTKDDGGAVNVQEAVKIPVEDEKFLTALADRINHLMKGPEQIFAIKEVSRQ
ncbi:MAG: hypothetical protein IJU48_04200 [Synergistaceae bacterium]|nr:hypothetical protein [Synergistaceae bacterium]